MNLKLIDMEIDKRYENLEWLKAMNEENEMHFKSIQQDVINTLSDGLNKKLENLIIEGLKNKGFEIENTIELENFIKTRCKKEDYIEFKKHIYYVDEIPFFVHYYEVIFELITEDNNGIKMNANYGNYAFL